MNIATAYTVLYSSALVYLAVLMAVMLVRAVRTQGTVNRLIATNMIGTMINAAVLILSARLQESWLIDVALVYTMISFVSVLILSRISLPAAGWEEPDSGLGKKAREKGLGKKARYE